MINTNQKEQLEYIQVQINKRKWHYIKKSKKQVISLQKTIADAVCKDDLVLLTNRPIQAKYQQHNMEQAVGGIDLYGNTIKQSSCIRSQCHFNK